MVGCGRNSPRCGHHVDFSHRPSRLLPGTFDENGIGISFAVDGVAYRNLISDMTSVLKTMAYPAGSIFEHHFTVASILSLSPSQEIFLVTTFSRPNHSTYSITSAFLLLFSGWGARCSVGERD
jgi:hypothetical protein